MRCSPSPPIPISTCSSWPRSAARSATVTTWCAAATTSTRSTTITPESTRTATPCFGRSSPAHARPSTLSPPGSSWPCRRPPATPSRGRREQPRSNSPTSARCSNTRRAGLPLLIDFEADGSRSRLWGVCCLFAQVDDPAVRQPAFLGALDQVGQQPSARGASFAPLLGPGHERLRGDALLSGVDGDVDLLGQSGRDPFLAKHGVLRGGRNLEEDAMDGRVLVFRQVGHPPAPEAALHVEYQPIPVQDRRHSPREQARVDAVLRRPLAHVLLRPPRSVREVAVHARHSTAGVPRALPGGRLVLVRLERLALAVQRRDHVVQALLGEDPRHLFAIGLGERHPLGDDVHRPPPLRSPLHYVIDRRR